MLQASSNNTVNETIDLVNSNGMNLNYYGSLYFGTPLQTKTNSTFAFDTSASFTAVTSRFCRTCETQYYDYYASETYVPLPAYQNLTKIQLVFERQVEFHGFYMDDYMCLDQNSTLCTYQQTTFFLIEESVGTFELDGILSLAPWGASPGAGGHYSYADFMWIITSNKTLDEPVLGLRLEDANGTSEAHFGGVDTDSYTGDIFPYDLYTSQFWGVDFNSSWFGGNPCDKSGATQAAISSGTSYIYMPKYDFGNFSLDVMDTPGVLVNGTYSI